MDQMQQIHERLATLEANETTLFRQVREAKGDIKDIRQLTEAVAKIAAKTESIDQKIDSIDDRLNDVEQAPAKDYTYYRRTIISGAITGVIGIILGALLALIIH